MAAYEQNDLSRQKREAERPADLNRLTRGSSLWWFVWLPIIVVITLWIGGWWFGNYGGPWGSTPPSDHLSITDPAVFIRI